MVKLRVAACRCCSDVKAFIQAGCSCDAQIQNLATTLLGYNQNTLKACECPCRALSFLLPVVCLNGGQVVIVWHHGLGLLIGFLAGGHSGGSAFFMSLPPVVLRRAWVPWCFSRQ